MRNGRATRCTHKRKVGHGVAYDWRGKLRRGRLASGGREECSDLQEEQTRQWQVRRGLCLRVSWDVGAIIRIQCPRPNAKS